MAVDITALLTSRWAVGGSVHHGLLIGAQDARLMVAEEPPPDSTFNVALLKALSGGGMMQFRDVGEKAGAARPVRATLVIALNTGQEQSLDLRDDALTDRVRLLPYPKLPGPIQPDRQNAVSEREDVRRAVLALMVRWAVEAPNRPDSPPAVSDYTAERRRASIGELGIWLEATLDVTGRLVDRLMLDDVWGAAALEFGERAGLIEGVDRAVLLQLAREVCPGLPRAKRSGGRSYWPGVRFALDKDTMPTCAQCGKTGTFTLDEEGLCPPCRMDSFGDGPTAGDAAQAPLDLDAALDAELAATAAAHDAELMEYRRAVGAGEAADPFPHSTTALKLSGLRAVRASNPGRKLPPAIVDELGGVEHVLDSIVEGIERSPREAPAADWAAVWAGVKREAEERRDSRISETAGWLPRWLGERLSPPLPLGTA